MKNNDKLIYYLNILVKYNNIMTSINLEFGFNVPRQLIY